MTENPKHILNKYQQQSVLKEDNYSRTLSALNKDTQQEVIIKELHFKRLKNWKSLELFEREANILQNLDHPRIPKLIEFIQIEEDDEYILYLITEKVAGKTLAQLLEEGWHPTEQQVKSFCIELLDILSYLYQLNPPVIHRDIKPSNIMINEEGDIHLIDFGAVQNMLHPEGSSTVVGTYGYMAPEQFSGKAVPASDIYGLGATLIHILSGQPPSKLPQKELRIDFKAHVNISKSFSNCIDLMIEPIVEKRYQRPDEVIQQLNQAPKILDTTPKVPELPPVLSSQTEELSTLSGLEVIQKDENLHITLPSRRKNTDHFGSNLETVSGGLIISLFCYFMINDSHALSLNPSLIYLNYVMIFSMICSSSLSLAFMPPLYDNLFSHQIEFFLTPETFEIHHRHGLLKRKIQGQTQNIQGLFSSTKRSFLKRFDSKSLSDETYVLDAGSKQHGFTANLTTAEYRELQGVITEYVNSNSIKLKSGDENKSKLANKESSDFLREDNSENLPEDI